MNSLNCILGLFHLRCDKMKYEQYFASNNPNDLEYITNELCFDVLKKFYMIEKQKEKGKFVRY